MSSTTLLRSTSQPLWLTLARLFQVVMICLTIGLFIISIPINYEHLSKACQTEPCSPGELTPITVKALKDIGMPLDTLIKITVGSDILFAVIYTASAILIFIRK